ncbi:MAG: carboxypeptidase-like regulatory domain-containing protein [Puia sp.]
MRKWLLFAGLLLSCSLIFAQTEVTGKITDSKTGMPIPGASVKIKSSKKGTTTSPEGVFKLPLTAGDILEISAVGFKSQSVKVTGLSDISVLMEESAAELNEVVGNGKPGYAQSKNGESGAGGCSQIELPRTNYFFAKSGSPAEHGSSFV